jgi:protocatechuate 3,4-dioxygenase beta subunit
VDGDGSFKPGTDLPVDFAESANDGSYLFENLPPGDYIVVAEEQTVAAPPSSANAGKFGVMVATTGTKHAVSLSANQDYALADFGFIESAEVEGHVFHDKDHNGSFDGSEVGLPSVTVTLTGTTDDGTVITLTVATDAAGEYKFIVPPGEYVVTYEQSDIPDEYTETTTETSFEVSVDAGQEVDDLDFGVDHGGIIGDTVWYDFLVNGNQDFGEPGLDGVTIELYDNNNELVAITATDDEGHYAFVGLPDGNYTVNPDETTLPPNYILTTANDPYAAEITDGGSDLDADFGYQYFDIFGTPVYELSGTVWDDVDGSGDINGETGIPDVRVVVECDTGTYYATTNASGFWQVSGILEGSNCTINADESTLPSTAYQPTTPDELTVTNITSDQADLDFGYQEQLGSVAGTVCEGDTSGSCGAGELPLPGVTVTLNYAGQDGRFGTSDDTTDSTTTLADGSYSFDDLPPGLYQIVETNPATHESISDADGGNPDNISLILVAGADLVDQDFEDRIGQFPSIGNAVWIDENADGIQNPGEPGLANIVVELWDSSGSTLVMTTTTDTNGGYLFKTVLPDIYQVKVDETSLPIGLFVSTLGANPGDDLNNQAQPYSVTVALNDEDLSADFGYIWTDPANVTGNTGNGALGDRIWIDSNGDGVQDPGEAGLPGATVQLYTDPDGNGVYDTPHGAPVVSGPDGSYIFTNLPPAAYVVGVTPPAGYTNTGGPVDQPIVLDPGDVYLNADFGYQPTGITNAITGTVWYDDNADGSQGVDEDPTLGVSVALIDDAGNIIATTITDGNGEYTFSGLPDGTYTVWVNDTENILGELDPTYDADGIVTSNMSTVPVAGGTPAPDQDFGYAPPNHTSTDGLIGDTVFLDRNGNSQPNIGEGMEGIAVGLFDSTGSILLDSTMTDENGHYAFGGLDAGDYVVKVFRETFRSGSETLVNTVDPDAGRADQSAVELSSAEINRLQDFGYAASGGTLIGGTVWEDGNADGTLNETGSGISGVTVVLLDSAGNIVAKTTTASNGSYSFNGVAAGTYTVHITDDDGLLAGHWHTLGTNPGADNNSQVDPYTVVVAANTSNTTADFGYYQQPAGLGDFVWADDGDGIQQALEPGVAGVTVTLSITYPNGIVLTLVTTTDDNGLYSFDNLLLDEGYNGSGGVGVGGDTPQYVVTVAAPESASATLLNQGDGTNDSDDPAGTEAAVIQGVTNDAYDFGFKDAPTAVVLRVASVTDENIPLQAMFIAIILTTMTIGLNMYRRARRE